MFAGKLIKQIIFSIIVMMIGIANSFSQATDSLTVAEKKDRDKLSISDIQDLTKDGFNFWQDKFSGHFAGIGFGFNTFINEDYLLYSVDEAGFMDNDIIRSNSLFINIFSQSIGLQHNKNTVGLVTGLGLQLQSYRLDKSTTITTELYGKVKPETLYFDDNQKSKLSVAYIIAPLLLEFQIPVRHYANRLYFSGGLYGGARVSSHTKIKYRVDRKKEKLKTPDDFSIHKFKYGIMARAGYRCVNVFFTYDFSTFFKEDLGPELTPVTIGITLLEF